MHANAVLTPKARLKLARLVVLDGVPRAQAAKRFQCAYTTVNRWAARFEELHNAGIEVTVEHMADRSSRPHRQPTKTPQPVVRKIVHIRWKRKVGPVEIASILGVPASTVHAVLRRCRISRLNQVDRVTGEPVRRYEHDAPGDLLHMDVKKLGQIPDGGGHRMIGRQQGRKHRAATPGKKRNAHGNKKMGHTYVHTAVDDNSRVAYAENHDDETATTAVGVLRRTVAFYAARGVKIKAILTDNGSCYRSHAWRDACNELGIKHKRTRPYRPQTNGKVERFHRTLAAGWAFRRLYLSESARRNALKGYLHEYNHHRLHSAIGKATPISRLTNLSGQYS